MTRQPPTLTADEISAIQVLPIKLIIAAANGQINLNTLAKKELASRGLNQSGTWVGFEQARALLDN